MSTPMMQQWHTAKERHREGILFFRMGDFFEFFHDDAKTAARLLGLTLTSRSKGDGAIPMAGVPVRNVNAYVRKLVNLGHKVVICDQVEDPATAEGLVEREVTRIVTPGTVAEEEGLDEKDHNFLAALAPANGGFALAQVELTTGAFIARFAEGGDPVRALAGIEAAELLVPEGLAATPALREAIVRSMSCALTVRPDWCFDGETAIRQLNRHFGTRRLDGFGIDEGRHRLGAAGAILDYLEETQRGAVGQIRTIRWVDEGGCMRLDRSTRSSLEIVRTLRDGERKGSLLDVVDRTVTSMGARLLKSWLQEPLVDVDPIVERQDAVAELHGEREMADALRQALSEALDLERLAGRVGSHRANPRDLRAVAQTVDSLPRIAGTLRPAAASWIRELVSRLPDLEGLGAQLSRALVDEPPFTLAEGGVIREGYSVELDELRALRREGHDFIAAFQAKEIEATGIQSLKIGFNRVFGYYIEVTNVYRDRVPSHYRRKQTLKNCERFVTPELNEYEQKVLHAEERSIRLEQELFQELRDAAEARIDDLQEAARILAVLDVLQSMAWVARKYDWRRPAIGGDQILRIEEGRHPVLDVVGAEETLVPNDVDLDDARRVMLITGPNMAGKSTYIRQVALITLLAQTGSFVPAKSARIGVVDQIFTRVGASDDLARGNSTFMVEMLEVANILNNATARSLVILDEVGRGTSTWDGLSLAWAVTEHLAKGEGVKTLFATHYHELTAIAEERATVVNHNVAVREWGEEIIFLHKIVPGAADRSYGIHVARLAGLPRVVIDEARRILDRLEASDSGPRSPVGASGRDAESHQLSLFDAAPDLLREKLAQVDVDRTTPLDALRLLAELKRLV